ncbi:S-adenosyl-L-methionine-dependent methyltransferase [Penicillium odoratum]|uniref:S-adenosyl-L-methionine-dependent methyltransferase n=1 Tax=Penicillium odoratum TaxID=1167516 RepID=UPI0025471C8E|nr:S-adenosyl-L-methionine-dependent methyltransferase [Penicillium odoratum]KAJ5772366.1 S-adenosyl-L-methionine-dependent methyltransferase [Penicillium odoratum]
MLEKPEEVVFRQAFEPHTHNCCLRVAVDLRLFYLLAEYHPNPLSSSDLAKVTGAEEELLESV